ncbi:MAG: asparagine--tRNA ligase [Fibromonadaceae bacterium]|jgi:asparaginyl-tRNA synthetase|nr:asparagine--tRNA ligase [Fibromonadaceae bacterium]
MSQPCIRNLKKNIGEEVSLSGWGWNIRGSGKVQFLQFRDGTGFVQVVAGASDISSEEFDLLRSLGQESSVKIKGKVVENAKSPIGVEIVASKIELISNTKNYPISPKEHGTDFLMDNRHLWIRSPRQQAILRIRHNITKSIRNYFDELDFTLIDAPIFTPNECEGSSTLFSTDYFGENAFLSQSGQLYMEAACAAFGKAYCFGPTFRAENSNTRRHLTEFWMVEPEVAYMDLEGDMELAEGLILRIVRDVLKTCPNELAIIERSLEPLQIVAEAKSFPRISYSDAVQILKNAGENFEWGDDFGGAHETIICSQFKLPVIVHNYPSSIKPFYMKQASVQSGEPQTVKNMDILAPEGYGEIIGGGERESDLEILKNAMAKQKLNEKDYEWYLDLRRYGSIPHAGFGLGLERAVSWICGLSHVRETGAFPRLPKRLRP